MVVEEEVELNLPGSAMPWVPEAARVVASTTEEKGEAKGEEATKGHSHRGGRRLGDRERHWRSAMRPALV